MVKFRVRESKPEPKEPEVEFWLELDNGGDLMFYCKHNGDVVGLGFIDSGSGVFELLGFRAEIPGICKNGRFLQVHM